MRRASSFDRDGIKEKRFGPNDFLRIAQSPVILYDAHRLAISSSRRRITPRWHNQTLILRVRYSASTIQLTEVILIFIICRITVAHLIRIII